MKSYKIAIISPHDGELVADVWMTSEEVRMLKRLRTALVPTSITSPRIIIYDNTDCKPVK